MSSCSLLPPLTLNSFGCGSSFIRPRSERRFYSTSTSPTTTNKNTDEMASDEDYSSFLDKANEDPSSGTAKSQSSGKKELKALDEGVEVPAILKKATEDAFYVSDADEPFVPVALKWSGKKLPGESKWLDSFLSLYREIPSPY